MEKYEKVIYAVELMVYVLIVAILGMRFGDSGVIVGLLLFFPFVVLANYTMKYIRTYLGKTEVTTSFSTEVEKLPKRETSKETKDMMKKVKKMMKEADKE